VAYVYVLRSGNDDVFKIGRTRGDVDARVRSLATGNPQPLTRFDVNETEHDSLCETYLHNQLRSRRRGGEFFAIDAAELEAVIAEAREFIADYVPKHEEAERLASEKSDERVLEPSEAERELHPQLLEVREALDGLELERARLETALKLAIGTGDGLDGIASWKSHCVQRFGTAAFQVAEPLLHR
jgi:hypothetical protein